MIPLQVSGRDFLKNIHTSANYNETFMRLPTTKKNKTEQTNIKARKRLAPQELKWCVLVLCVISKDPL